MFVRGRDHVVIHRLDKEYPDLINYVVTNGETVESRIGATAEVLDLRLHLIAPQFCLVGRKGMSDHFAYEEITQLLAGVHVNERLAAIVPRAAELTTPATAYGPRTWEQVEAVCHELEDSPNSRRAVVYIGRPDDLVHADDADRAAEMPCTMTWQFHLRSELHMNVAMRSWDLVWGLSYDIPSFVAVQHAVADHLGVGVGDYVHTAGSAHVYDRHWELETWERDDGLLVLDHLLRGRIDLTREYCGELLDQTSEAALATPVHLEPQGSGTEEPGITGVPGTEGEG